MLGAMTMRDTQGDRGHGGATLGSRGLHVTRADRGRAGSVGGRPPVKEGGQTSQRLREYFPSARMPWACLALNDGHTPSQPHPPPHCLSSSPWVPHISSLASPFPMLFLSSPFWEFGEGLRKETGLCGPQTRVLVRDAPPADTCSCPPTEFAAHRFLTDQKVQYHIHLGSHGWGLRLPGPNTV